MPSKIDDPAARLVGSFFILSASICFCSALTIEELAVKYAPTIWFHHEEAFYPSSVEFFFPEVRLLGPRGQVLLEDVTPYNLPTGIDTEDFFLTTKQPLACAGCTDLDIFLGEPLTSSSVIYAVYYQYEDDPAIIDISYNVFHPYNRGKEVCVGIPGEEDCYLGEYVTFGNHVGDWEHVTIRLWDEQPWSLYVSCHSFGSFYTYNDTTGQFDFEKGDVIVGVDEKKPMLIPKGALHPVVQQHFNDLGENKGLLDPDFPEHVAMLDGTHPVVFSANGSHGFWGAAGDHVYLSLLGLTDKTSEGVRWDTWTSKIVLIPGSFDDEYPENVHWMNYRGRWGNDKDDCGLEFITGECVLGSGPGGPDCCSEFRPPTIPPWRMF